MSSTANRAERLWLGRLALEERWRLWKKPAYRRAAPTSGANGLGLLEELIRTKKAIDLDGKARDTTAFITAQEGTELHRLIVQAKPRLALEIGFLHGYSTLHLLQGLADVGAGQLVSIDPGQFSEYAGGVGLMNVRRAGLHRFHAHMNAGSQFALPELARRRITIDFAFIDGNHLFDYTLLEFFYLDQILRVGGTLIFHDYLNPSVFTALNYIEANFAYAVADCPARNLRVVTKQAHDTRPWYYFVPFRVPQIAWTSADVRPMVDPASEQP